VPCGRCNAPIGKLELEPSAGLDIGCRVQGMTGLISNQGKAARQHAAIGQGGEQLPAMKHPRLKPIQHGQHGALGARGQALRPLELPRNRIAVGLRVGKLRGFQARFQPGVPFAAAAQQRAGAMAQPLA